MQFIKPGINIDFIGRRRMAFIFSSMMIIATIVLLIWRGGPNYGVDFSGGVLVQVKLPHKISPSKIKKALKPVQLEDSIVQEFGESEQSEYLIRIRKTNVELRGLSDSVEQALNEVFGKGVETPPASSKEVSGGGKTAGERFPLFQRPRCAQVPTGFSARLASEVKGSEGDFRL